MGRRSNWATACVLMVALGTGIAQWIEEEWPMITREDRQARWNGDQYGKLYGNQYRDQYNKYGRQYSGQNDVQYGRGNRRGCIGCNSNQERANRERPAGVSRKIAQAAPGRKASSGGGGEAQNTCGVTKEMKRIINGEVARRGEFPWQAGLVYERGDEKRVLCGGSLIHPRFVLTAAHCFDPAVIKRWKLRDVRLGLVDQRLVDKDARSYVPEKITQHPNYRGGRVNNIRNANDIAMMRLPQAAPYTDYIRPVCLPGLEQKSSKGGNVPKVLVTSGWGETENGTFSHMLLYAPVGYMNSEECSRKLQVTIPDTQVCAGGDNKDSCKGDSGGPLVRTVRNSKGAWVFEIVGVVSFGEFPCNKETIPGVYTRVASYIGWIQQIMKEQG